MKEFEFYNVAKEGTIRQAVADMMTSNKELSKLEGKVYYEVEDAICELIEHNRFKIKNEVQREEIRDMIISEIIAEFTDYYDDEDDVPDDLVEEMVDEFFDDFYESDSYNDNVGLTISDIVYSYERELTE